jgi:hypothetical protein
LTQQIALGTVDGTGYPLEEHLNFGLALKVAPDRDMIFPAERVLPDR